MSKEDAQVQPTQPAPTPEVKTELVASLLAQYKGEYKLAAKEVTLSGRDLAECLATVVSVLQELDPAASITEGEVSKAYNDFRSSFGRCAVSGKPGKLSRDFKSRKRSDKRDWQPGDCPALHVGSVLAELRVQTRNWGGEAKGFLDWNPAAWNKTAKAVFPASVS